MKKRELVKCGIHEGKEWLPEKQKLSGQPLYKIFGRLGESSWFGQSGLSTTTNESNY